MATNLLTRIAHDVGLSAWFGGTLANAVSLNRAAGQVPGSAAGAVTNAGWNAWTPVNAAAIGLHLVGAAQQLYGNKSRLAGQAGVGTMSVIKTGLTVAALGTTVYSGVLGRKIASQHDVPLESGTEPSSATPPDIADAVRRQKVLQWVIPALTGGLVVTTSWAGEQQRPQSVASGILRRLLPS